MSGEHSVAYAGVHQRLHELLGATAVDAVPVPACPEWTIAGVVSHLVGLARAWIDGDTDGYASGPWTAAQVAARSGASLDELFAEWDAVDSSFRARLEDPGRFDLPRYMPGITVADATIHEHDIRGALRDRGARDTDAVAMTLSRHLRGFDRKLAAGGSGAVTITTEDGEQSLGDGEAIARLDVPRFELFRSFSGRRSRQQVEAWRWEGDSRQLVDGWLDWPFEWAATDLEE